MFICKIWNLYCVKSFCLPISFLSACCCGILHYLVFRDILSNAVSPLDKNVRPNAGRDQFLSLTTFKITLVNNMKGMRFYVFYYP